MLSTNSSSNTSYLEFDLDSSLTNVSAGTVYIRLIANTGAIVGDITKLSNC